jgi:hypothetical protein
MSVPLAILRLAGSRVAVFVWLAASSIEVAALACGYYWQDTRAWTTLVPSHYTDLCSISLEAHYALSH